MNVAKARQLLGLCCDLLDAGVPREVVAPIIEWVVAALTGGDDE